MLLASSFAVFLLLSSVECQLFDDETVQEALREVVLDELVQALQRQTNGKEIDTAFGGHPSLSYPPAELNRAKIIEIKNFIKAKISRDQGLIADLVRIAFHHCAGRGGCNGFINTGDIHNRGLENVFANLKQWRLDSFQSVIRLADFISLAGFAAAEVGLSNAGCRNCAFRTFKAGRRTALSTSADLPDGKLTDGIQKLQSQFGLSRNDAVILLGGGHSVGGCIVQCNGRFDDTPNALDNKWFLSFRDTTNFKFSPENNNQRLQWKPVPAQGTNMMLTCDLAAGWDVQVDSNGLNPNCGDGVRSCRPLTELFSTVPRMAGNAQTFFTEFMRVFSIMSETTSEALKIIQL